MRKLPVFLLALFVGLTSIGCDSTSSEDDLSDSEIFVGTWALVGLSDDEGDKLTLFSQVANSFTAILNADDSFSVLIDYEAQDDLQLSGTYLITEGAKLIVLSSGGLGAPFTYDIESENRIELSAQAAIVNALFQTEAYVGTVRIVIQRT